MFPALDVQNFAVDWPRWRDQFQVHVAANFNHHLSDGEKLSMLLECLGADGSTLAGSLYYPQKNLVVQDAFDEVWWRMNELSDVDFNKRWLRDRSEERRKQMESSFQVGEINSFK